MGKFGETRGGVGKKWLDNFFNNDVIISSLVTNLNSSTAQELVNWVTPTLRSHRRHDATQLDSYGGTV